MSLNGLALNGFQRDIAPTIAHLFVIVAKHMIMEISLIGWNCPNHQKQKKKTHSKERERSIMSGECDICGNHTLECICKDSEGYAWTIDINTCQKCNVLEQVTERYGKQGISEDQNKIVFLNPKDLK